MKFVTVIIAGTTYRIQFTHNTIADMEQVAGMGLNALFTRQMGWAAARYLLWAGLADRYKTVTLARAGELLGLYQDEHGSIDKLSLAIWEGLKVGGFMKEPPKSVEGEPSEQDDDEGEPRVIPPSQSTTSENPTTSATEPSLGS